MTPEQRIIESTLDKLVEAFLAWPLPESVCADKCACDHGCPNRIGTNLLTAIEARQMFEHVFAQVSNENRPKSFHDIAMAMKHSAHVADLESEIDLLRGALTKIQLECSPRSFTTPEEYEAVQKFISETLKSKEND